MKLGGNFPKNGGYPLLLCRGEYAGVVFFLFSFFSLFLQEVVVFSEILDDNLPAKYQKSVKREYGIRSLRFYKNKK